MTYSYKDICSLVLFLKGYEKDGYHYLISFFTDHLPHLQNGLKEPGSAGSALVIKELEQWYPDALYALRMPENELPLYLDRRVGMEYPIVLWRMQSLSLQESGEVSQ